MGKVLAMGGRRMTAITERKRMSQNEVIFRHSPDMPAADIEYRFIDRSLGPRFRELEKLAEGVVVYEIIGITAAGRSLLARWGVAAIDPKSDKVRYIRPSDAIKISAAAYRSGLKY